MTINVHLEPNLFALLKFIVLQCLWIPVIDQAITSTYGLRTSQLVRQGRRVKTKYRIFLPKRWAGGMPEFKEQSLLGGVAMAIVIFLYLALNAAVEYGTGSDVSYDVSKVLVSRFKRFFPPRDMRSDMIFRGDFRLEIERCTFKLPNAVVNVYMPGFLTDGKNASIPAAAICGNATRNIALSKAHPVLKIFPDKNTSNITFRHNCRPFSGRIFGSRASLIISRNQTNRWIDTSNGFQYLNASRWSVNKTSLRRGGSVTRKFFSTPLHMYTFQSLSKEFQVDSLVLLDNGCSLSIATGKKEVKEEELHLRIESSLQLTVLYEWYGVSRRRWDVVRMYDFAYIFANPFPSIICGKSRTCLRLQKALLVLELRQIVHLFMLQAEGYSTRRFSRAKENIVKRGAVIATIEEWALCLVMGSTLTALIAISILEMKRKRSKLWLDMSTAGICSLWYSEINNHRNSFKASCNWRSVEIGVYKKDEDTYHLGVLPSNMSSEIPPI